MPDLDEKWELVACPSFTLRERASGQLMHSRIGPWTEANTVYVGQSDPLAESVRRDSTVLYDVGMGIAANALAAIAARKEGSPLKIFSFERHPEALAVSLEHPEKFPFQAPYREILQALLKNGEWGSRDLVWRLISGDFRRAALEGLPAADLVYFDFYAPSACPELWGIEIFSSLRPKMAEQGLLITYSSTKAVRAALLLSGFFVGEGRATAMKNTTTLASPSRNRISRPLDESWLRGLVRAGKPLPDGWRSLDAHPQFASHT